MKHAPYIVAVVALISTLAGAAWQRSASTGWQSAKLALGSVEGVKIESAKDIGRASALVSGRLSEEATLPKGASEAVINLGRQAILERVAMHNVGSEGRVAIFSSTDNDSWVPLGQTVFSPVDSEVMVPFASIQAKYVKVEFELSRAGGLRNFKIFGSLVAGSKDKLRGKVNNMASAVGGARVVYVNPTPATGEDTARYGSFSFPESDEKYRTVIYDLGRPKVLNEFGSVHSPRPVRFEVFTFNELPEKEDWKGRRSFDPAVFDQKEPVATVEDKEGKGYVKCKPEAAVTAQFVALRWEPDFNPPAFIVGGVEIIGPSVEIDDNSADEAGEAGEGQGQGQGTGGNTSGGEVIANPTAMNGFSGPFAPNSLMGAGSGGLPAVPQDDPTPTPNPGPPVFIPPVSPAP